MNANEINTLIENFNSTDLTRLKIKQDDFSIELERVTTAVQVSPATVQTTDTVVSTPAPTQDKEKKTALSDTYDFTINSPMVGTFYAAPAPDAQPFVKVGDSIRRGQKVAIVEAMKIMNEIEAEYDCEIVKILVKDGQVVDFDMPLFAVKKL
jgi:acetyl-CoA carboxylase biotin carboxyl carrier protein